MRFVALVGGTWPRAGGDDREVCSLREKLLAGTHCFLTLEDTSQGVATLMYEDRPCSVRTVIEFELPSAVLPQHLFPTVVGACTRPLYTAARRFIPTDKRHFVALVHPDVAKNTTEESKQILITSSCSN